MSETVIPDEAVEAATDKLLEILPRVGAEIPLWAMLQALEAAAPHIATAGYGDESCCCGTCGL